MSDQKISELSAITSLSDADLLYIASGGNPKKITGANLKASIAAGGLPGIMCAAPPHTLVASLATIGGANASLGVRVVAPVTGTVTKIAWYVGGTSSGNVDVGIFSTAATRARLGSSGSTACGSANAWQAISLTAGVAVTKGTQYDLMLALDNNTATLGRLTVAAYQSLRLPAGFIAAGGASPWLNFASSGANFPLGATIAEAAMAETTVIPALIALIT